MFHFLKGRNDENRKENLYIFSIIFFLVVILFLSLFMINHYSSSHGDNKNKKITATFYPYYLMLKDLGINSTVIIDPYSNPHTYTPTTKDFIKLNKYKYVVVDGYIDKEIIKNLGNDKILLDPTPLRHGWINLETIINLSKMLNKEGFNVKVPLQVKTMIKRYKGMCNGVKVVTLHKGLEDVLKYYGINVVRSLVGNDDEELSINDIQYLKNNKDYCFVIATSPSQVDVLNKYGIKKYVYLYLMGRKYNKGEEDYLQIMKNNLEEIYNACKRCNSKD